MANHPPFAASHPHFPFDLRARAHEAMTERGFAPDFTPEAERQAQQAQNKPLTAASDPAMRDLRDLLWSSIDNDESRDLDQVEVAEQRENGVIRVLVGVADVDSFVPKGSPVDAHAAQNTTSVYMGVAIFPMLPEELSTDATSLVGEEDRLAMVIDMLVGTDGTVTQSDIYRAVVRNHAKLAYNAVGAWLEGREPIPPGVARVPGMEAQLRLQHEASQRLEAERRRQGALDLETIEAEPVVQDGHVVALTVAHKGPARLLIENFMIAANTAMAVFLESTGLPSIQRVVRSPERWSRIREVAAELGGELPMEPDSQALAAFLVQRKAADPVHFPDLSLTIVKLLGPGEYTVVRSEEDRQGHFGLAVHNYTHSTAPNRRFADLVTQRLCKSALGKAPPPYAEDELEAVAQHCTEREDAARKVERLMRKVIAAVLLGDRIGQMFDAIVTGASYKGTYVRVTSPPVEGRVVRGEQGMDVGDKVRVRLIHTDPNQGFIDFARA